MPLPVFINAVVDEDYSQIKNFEDVYMDYCQAIGGKELVIQMERLKEIHELHSRIKVAELCIQMLRLRPTKEVWDALYSLDYQCTVHEYDESRVEEGIASMKPYINLDIVDLQVLQNRVKDVKGGKYTRDYFTEMLIDIGIAFKKDVPETITLRQYCAYVVKYKNYVERMNKQMEAQ
jgi:hypothetical protein